MTNEQVFGNVIMLMSRFEAMLQNAERNMEQMVEEVKAVTQINNDLKAKNEELKEENIALRAKIASLENNDPNMPEEL